MGVCTSSQDSKPTKYNLFTGVQFISGFKAHRVKPSFGNHNEENFTCNLSRDSKLAAYQNFKNESIRMTMRIRASTIVDFEIMTTVRSKRGRTVSKFVQLRISRSILEDHGIRSSWWYKSQVVFWKSTRSKARGSINPQEAFCNALILGVRRSVSTVLGERVGFRIIHWKATNGRRVL